jgi:hypothetical protein
VLVDFDNYPHPPRINEATVDAQVITPVVHGPFAKSKDDCAASGAHTIARATGGYTGAFTKRGATEQLYMVHTRDCGSDAPDKHHLVILGDGKVEVDVEVPERMIAFVHDLDQDGDNEILLIGAHKDNEAVVFTARMVDTEDGHFDTLFDFKEISRSTCPDGGAESALIKYRISGTRIEYAAEKRARPCKPKT